MTHVGETGIFDRIEQPDNVGSDKQSIDGRDHHTNSGPRHRCPENRIPPQGRSYSSAQEEDLLITESIYDVVGLRQGGAEDSLAGQVRLLRFDGASKADFCETQDVMPCRDGACRKAPPEHSWLARILARKPRMLVAIALANKMARSVWAMMTKNEDYKDSALAAA